MCLLKYKVVTTEFGFSLKIVIYLDALKKKSVKQCVIKVIWVSGVTPKVNSSGGPKL